MKLRTLMLATPIIAVPTFVYAQPVTGLYIGAGVGWNYLFSEDLKNVATQSAAFGGLPVPNKSVNFGSGIVAVGSIGYGLGNGLRLELEGNYRGNSKNQDTNSTAVTRNGAVVFSNGSNGSEQKAGAMVNILYDFTDAFGKGITPYVGGGIGWNYARINNVQLGGILPAGLPSAGGTYLFRFNNGQNAFAYQAIIGLSYDIPSVPGLALTGEARYFGLDGRTYKGQFFAPNVARGANVQVGMENNVSVIVGVRYAFNAAPPAPPPLPPPAPVQTAARTYLVFFDWDRADLTDRARQIIADAAHATTTVQVTRIEVNGYTDLSGTARYNQGLSQRRATNVANELVRDGVPREAISVHGYGESNPLVPTSQGVREAQNRRVEIILK